MILFLAVGGTLLPPGAPAGQRFTDNGDGTITDHRLNLMWAARSNEGDISWEEARKWVRYTFPDTLPVRYDGWRLPTVEELRSLGVEAGEGAGYETECGQWVEIVPRIRLTCGWVWSSEVRSITAVVYNFNRGYHYTDRKVHDRAYRALPVRDLE